ncbi:MAG TPA: MFS transporter [Caulobacteraceae bacterium]|nr:MFS transporter [Caulobacteraceae bacterium]
MATAADTTEGDAPAADTPVRLTRLRLGFVLAVVLLNTTSLGIVSPVLPILVKRLAHGDTIAAAEAIGVFTAAWAAMQLFFAPVLGVLSDRFGRRPVALISLVELSADYVVMALAPALGWLFLGRVLSGGAAAGRAAMFAYVADVAAPEERTRYFALVAAAGGAGTVMGPSMGGLLGEIGPRAPFWVAAGIGLFNAAYGFFVLKESLPRSARTPFSWVRANPFHALWILFEGKGLLGLAVIMFLANVGMSAFSSIYVLYVNYRYGWGTGLAGLVLTAYAAATIVMQGFLAGPAVKRLGEKGAIVLAFACGVAALGLIGLAAWSPLLWLGVVLIAPVNIGIAAIQSLRSQLVEPSEQGRLQGAMISLAGLAGIAGPVLFAVVFAWSIGAGRGFALPGLAMLTGAGVFALAMLLSLVIVRPRPAPSEVAKV